MSQFCDRLICDHCEEQNSQDCICAVQARDIFVRFVTAAPAPHKPWILDLHRSLGPRVPVSNADTLRRLLA